MVQLGNNPNKNKSIYVFGIKYIFIFHSHIFQKFGILLTYLVDSWKMYIIVQGAIAQYFVLITLSMYNLVLKFPII